MDDYYFVSLGSNIAPYQNIPGMLSALLELAGRIDVSRIIESEPINIVGGQKFLNLSVGLRSSLAPAALKERFNQIEIALGRDRSATARKILAREADLDIMIRLAAEQKEVRPDLLPPEPFLRPALLELIDYLELTCPEQVPSLRPGVVVKVAEVEVGLRPLTLQRQPTTGHIDIVRPPR